MFFQDFFGGITLKRIPSEKGSRLSTNSNSALPPSVMSWYMDFRCEEMVVKPVMNCVSRRERRSVSRVFAESRVRREALRSVVRVARSAQRRRYSPMTERSMAEALETFSSRAAMDPRRWSLDLSWSSSRV